MDGDRALLTSRDGRPGHYRVGPGQSRAHRDPGDRARRGGDARLRSPRHPGKRARPLERRRRGARLRDGAGEHLPPLPAPGGRAHRRAGRTASLHGLEGGDHHRLGRLPGVLDGPRHGRGRDQGPPGRRREHRRDRGHRGGRGALPLLPRRLRALPQPGDLDGGAGRPARRSRARLRRVHPLSRRPRLHRPLHRAHPSLARALPALARRARRGRVALLRHRAGGRPRGSAHRLQRRRGRERRGRHRHRRLPRRRQGADARGGRLVHPRARAPRPRTPPPPAGDRRGRRPDPGRGAGDRHLRLRDADPSGPPRHRARARPRQPLAPRGRSRRPAARRAPAPGGLPLPGLRGRALPRLPPPSAALRRAGRRATADPPQPHLHLHPDGAAAQRDRRRFPRPDRAGRARRSLLPWGAAHAPPPESAHAPIP